MSDRQHMTDDIAVIIIGGIVGMSVGTTSCLAIVTLIVLVSGWTEPYAILIIVMGFVMFGGILCALLGSVLFFRFWRHLGRLPTLTDAGPWNTLDRDKLLSSIAPWMVDRLSIPLVAFLIIACASMMEHYCGKTVAPLAGGAVGFVFSGLWWMVELFLFRWTRTSQAGRYGVSYRPVSGPPLQTSVYRTRRRILVVLLGTAIGASFSRIDEVNSVKLGASIVLAILATNVVLGGLLERVLRMWDVVPQHPGGRSQRLR